MSILVALRNESKEISMTRSQTSSRKVSEMVLTLASHRSLSLYIYIYLRPRGGRKLALQNGKVEGSEVGKNTALFLEAGVKSPLYVALCPDPPAREEREERRKDERQRGERERERRER